MPRYEFRSGGHFLELERDGLTVRRAIGTAERHRVREKTYPTEDAARYAYGLFAREAAGGTLVGPSRILTPVGDPPEAAGSALLVDELFAAADDRFDGEVLRVTAAGKLAALADRWTADARPWARRALLAYIDDGCDRPEHRVLVKRLFKHAEAAADDELMAHFLVAFDGIGGRLLVPRYSDSHLRTDPLIRSRLRFGKAEARPSPRFSRATRTYLARRAYRYFRRLGFRDVQRYGRALRIALPLYRDEHLASPARFLDAWGLLHALYHASPVLRATPQAFQLAYKARLADLAPAPHFPAAWRDQFAALFALLRVARSQAVRAWLVAWLQLHHARELAALGVAEVLPLLTSGHEELQRLGLALLPAAPGLDTLPIATWLELLGIERIEILAVVCEIVAKHVTPARLTLAQCVLLACGPAGPVARLGLAWARTKKLATAEDLQVVATIGRARVPSVREDAAAWATQVITAHPAARPEHLRELCDAPHADAREHALAAVEATPALAPPALWFALTESPYPDVRTVVVRHAERWRADAPPATLVHVWSSALLAVHRGSATKARVPRAIADRLAGHPDEAPTLLPLLALALRSVRAPERAAALGALARAIRVSPALREQARAVIPELVVGDEVTA